MAFEVLEEAIIVIFTKIGVLGVLALQVVKQFLELIEIPLNLILLNNSSLLAFGFFLLGERRCLNLRLNGYNKFIVVVLNLIFEFN